MVETYLTLIPVCWACFDRVKTFSSSLSRRLERSLTVDSSSTNRFSSWSIFTYAFVCRIDNANNVLIRQNILMYMTNGKILQKKGDLKWNRGMESRPSRVRDLQLQYDKGTQWELNRGTSYSYHFIISFICFYRLTWLTLINGLLSLPHKQRRENNKYSFFSCFIRNRWLHKSTLRIRYYISNEVFDDFKKK